MHMLNKMAYSWNIKLNIYKKYFGNTLHTPSWFYTYEMNNKYYFIILSLTSSLMTILSSFNKTSTISFNPDLQATANGVF